MGRSSFHRLHPGSDVVVVRQLAAHDMGRGFEDIVVFAENRYDGAGPTQWK